MSEVIKQKVKFSRPKRIPKCALGQCPAASRTKQALTFACAAAFAAMRAATKRTRLKGGRHLIGASHDPPVGILISKYPVLPPFSCEEVRAPPPGGTLCRPPLRIALATSRLLVTPFPSKVRARAFVSGAIGSDHLHGANAPLNMVARNARDWSPSLWALPDP